MKWLQFEVRVIKFKAGTPAAKATEELMTRDWTQPCSIGFLMRMFPTYRQFAEWLYAMYDLCDKANDNFPALDQGWEDNWVEVDGHDSYQGQPIIWDGGFGMSLDDGVLYYAGAYGPGGDGGAAKRVVKPEDKMYWESTCSLEQYVR